MIVKVCGITCEQDARVAVAAGANALGFNFWPGSPRYLTPAIARGFVPLLFHTPLGLTLPRRIGLFLRPRLPIPL